jgi:hypothetical protein
LEKHSTRLPAAEHRRVFVTVEGMRHTVFRHRMAEEFGEVRSEMLAEDHVLSSLGGRTANQALEDGMQPKQVWLTICEAFEVPPERR